MERILKSYGEFCAEEISIRKALAGAAIGAGLALSSPAARTQVKAPEKAGIMKDVEAMKKDVVKVKIKKDIPVGKTWSLSNYSFDDTVYQSKGDISDKEIIEIFGKRIFSNKSAVVCSGLGELVDGYDRKKGGRVYFLEGRRFPKEKIQEYKDLLFDKEDGDLAARKWKYIRKNHLLKVDFEYLRKDMERRCSQVRGRMYRTYLDTTFGEKYSMAPVCDMFFVRESDIDRCLEIAKVFKSSGRLSIKDMIAFYNLGLMDGNLSYYFEDIFQDILRYGNSVDKSGQMKDLEGRVGSSGQIFWNNFDYAYLIDSFEKILLSIKENGVVKMNSGFLDLEGSVASARLLPASLKKGEEFVVDRIDDKIVKMVSDDGRTLYMSLTYSSDIVKDLEKIGDVAKEKNAVASKSVSDYAARMLDKLVENSQRRVDSFSKGFLGKTTVVRHIGKVKFINAGLLPFEDIRRSAEKDLFEKLTGSARDARDTSAVMKRFEENIKKKEFVSLRKDDGELRHIGLSDFSESDLGTGPLKYGKDLQMLIDGRVKIGMDKERVRFALGDPDDIDRTASKSGYEEIYIYRSSDFHKEGDRFYLDGSRGESTYLYFEGGLLVSIMDR